MNLLANHALRLAWLGEALLLAGQIERAGEQAAQALALAEQQGERGSQAYAWRLDRRDRHAARAARRRRQRSTPTAARFGLATELGMRPLAARCRLGLAAVHAAHRTHTAEARAERDAAVETLRELEMTHWLAEAEALGVAPG